ncbi:MAG: hypothetical protein LBR88_08600 [Zoogloeaceae bacterium]|jgi:type IV pilus assembly protein PilY1|nr:hypothetical protein [Zoogloeaceae bacterium]
MNQANESTKPVMHSHFHFVSRRALLFAAVLAVSATRAETLNISQTPLIVGGGLPPNVTFLFDTSFGMNAAILPSSAALFGRHSSQRRATYQNLAVRSVAVNKLAYNPAKTYTPPIGINGDLHPPAVFTAAWRDGFQAAAPDPHETVNLATQYRDRNLGTSSFSFSQPANNGNCVDNGSVAHPSYCGYSYTDEAPRSAYYTWLNTARAGSYMDGYAEDVKEKWEFAITEKVSTTAYNANAEITVAGVAVPTGKNTSDTCEKMTTNTLANLRLRIKCKLQEALGPDGWSVGGTGTSASPVTVTKNAYGDMPDFSPALSANGTGAELSLKSHVNGSEASAATKGCIHQVKKFPSTATTEATRKGVDPAAAKVFNVADLDPTSSTRNLYPAWCEHIVSNDGAPYECRAQGYSMKSLVGEESTDLVTLKNHDTYNAYLTDVNGGERYYKYPFQACFEIVEVGSERDQVLTAKNEADAKTNFANWYSYYNTRMNVIKSAAAQAIHGMDESVRVAFGVTGGRGDDETEACDSDTEESIKDDCRSGRAFGSRYNVWDSGSYRAGLKQKKIDGLAPDLSGATGFYALERGLRPFRDIGADDLTVPEKYRKKRFKSEVLDYLYSLDTAAIAQSEAKKEYSAHKTDHSNAAQKNNLASLRRALGEAGEYYRLKDMKGPWSLYPGLSEAEGTPKWDDDLFAKQRIQACRKSYTVLLTAGIYHLNNDDRPRNTCARNDQDSTSGQSFLSTADGCLGDQTKDYTDAHTENYVKLAGARMGPMRGVNNMQYLYEPRYPFADARKTTVTELPDTQTGISVSTLLKGQDTIPVKDIRKFYLGERIVFGDADPPAVYRVIQIEKNSSGNGGVLTLDRGLEQDAITDSTKIRRHDYTRYSDTLADVAMAYWKNDLLPGKNYDPTDPDTDKQDDEFANNVPMSTSDMAFWQHMNTIVLHMGDGASIRSSDPEDPGKVAPLIESISQGEKSEEWLIAKDPNWGYRTEATDQKDWCDGTHSGDGTGGVEWCNPLKSTGGADVFESPQRYLYGNDLLHAAINSFGAYVSVQSPEELTRALNQAVSAMKTPDATFAPMETNSTGRGRALIYQSRFASDGWYGRLEAYRLCTEADVFRDSFFDRTPTVMKQVLRDEYNKRAQCLEEGNLWVSPDWDASDRLAQQICGSSDPAKCKSFNTGDRKILFGSGTLLTSVGAWAGLTAEQQAAFGDETTFKWFLGDPSTEQDQINGTLRVRKANILKDDEIKSARTPLGDIVNSAPLFVGSDDFGFANAFGLSPDMRTKYRQRKRSSAFLTRPEVLYVGANDGMLHAFAAQANVTLPPEPNEIYNYKDGTPDSSDATVGLPAGSRDSANDFTEDGGKEYFAYVPGSLLDRLRDLSSPAYSHQYYVDGTPTVSDAWIGNKWNTVLVGSTGAGGSAYYALNVEDPLNPSVIWEKKAGDNQFERLGVAIGQASVVIIAKHPTEGGGIKSVAIFSNGYNSESKTLAAVIREAILYIVELDGNAVAKMTVPETTGCMNNGLSTPLVADLDKDGVADAAYAGDLCGNLWKFDLKNLSSTPVRLLQAKDDNGNRQPITASPEVAVTRSRSGKSHRMVYVGTGKFIEASDKNNVSPQTFYAVLDDLVDKDGNPTTVTRTDLLQQEITEQVTNNYTGLQGEGLRIISENTLSTNVEYKGFYLDLVVKGEEKKGERVIARPKIWSDRLILSTIEPGTDECMPEGTGWLYEIDPYLGGRLSFTAFDVDGNGEFGNPTDKVNGNNVSGREVGMGGGVMSRGANKYTANHQGQVTKTSNNAQGLVLGRRSWRQIR